MDKGDGGGGVRRLRCRPPYERWDCSCCGEEQKRPPASTLAGLVCEPCLDLGRKGEPFIPLTVRMVRPLPEPDSRPIVAVSTREQLAITEDGETFDLPGLVERIRDRKRGEHGRGRYVPPPERIPPAVVLTDHALDLLAYLEHSKAADSPFWQWQVSIRSGTAWRPEARSRRPREFLTPRPIRFGYASHDAKGKPRAKGRAHWYLLLDVTAFCELPDGWGEPDARELLAFGLDLRAWANREHLPILATVSAYGSRLLRDSRFGGGWRRKVPAATNRRIRRLLPGNHYQLLGRVGRSYPTAHKWDQHAAHHHAALISRFPHPDQLDARGWFRRPAPEPGTPMLYRGAIHAGTPAHRQLLSEPGMFVLAIKVPEQLAIDPLVIPALRTPGTSWQHVTSAELPAIREHPDVKLLDIFACWTSPEDDDRLREYAWWSGEQLDAAGTSPARLWLKPLLLAAYGMLAARPQRFRNGWRWCHQPDGMIGWQTRHGQLVALERATSKEREPQTANVLARAIIESQVRAESLAHARRLRTAGLRPVAVYADAVFAVGRVTAPETLSPAPWRHEGIIHDLTFESPGRYRSREETRLPGVPRIRSGVLAPALPYNRQREEVIQHGSSITTEEDQEGVGL